MAVDARLAPQPRLLPPAHSPSSRSVATAPAGIALASAVLQDSSRRRAPGRARPRRGAASCRARPRRVSPPEPRARRAVGATFAVGRAWSERAMSAVKGRQRAINQSASKPLAFDPISLSLGTALRRELGPLQRKGNADRGRDLQRAPAHAPRTHRERPCGESALEVLAAKLPADVFAVVAGVVSFQTHRICRRSSHHARCARRRISLQETRRSSRRTKSARGVSLARLTVEGGADRTSADPCVAHDRWRSKLDHANADRRATYH